MPAASASARRATVARPAVARPAIARPAVARPAVARPAIARPAIAHIRWDRIGRLAMLLVLLAIVYLYLSAAVSLLSTWRESRRDAAQVLALERQSRVLARQHAALVSQDAMQTQARRLGLVRSGERAYVVSGLPSN